MCGISSIQILKPSGTSFPLHWLWELWYNKPFRQNTRGGTAIDAPLYNALCALRGQKGLRMHMPGHKGKGTAAEFAAAAGLDYTEIGPTGNLYTGEGPIAAAEALAARDWGAAQAFFLTGGSTQGVLAGLSLCAGPGSRILLDRNAHRAFYNAMALLDLTPVYLDRPTAKQVSAALSKYETIQAVCITSPTYYGVIADVEEIAAVCRAHGAHLLVDEAHGAHFPFVGRGSCAAARGASVSVSSAHKTLPALGSTALLFTDGSFSPAAVREKTALFGTSSPSYLLMASIDWARAYLTEGAGGAAYRTVAAEAARLRAQINKRGVFHALCEADGLSLDPTRLTVDTGRGGLSGHQAGERLEQEYNILPEMTDRDRVVCILTCADTAEELERLGAAFAALEQFADAAPFPPCPPPPPPQVRRSIREAVFAPRRMLSLAEAAGCISASSIAPYPPGVSVVAPGEEITREIVEYLAVVGYDVSAPVPVLDETGFVGKETL